MKPASWLKRVAMLTLLRGSGSATTPMTLLDGMLVHRMQVTPPNPPARLPNNVAVLIHTPEWRKALWGYEQPSDPNRDSKPDRWIRRPARPNHSKPRNMRRRIISQKTNLLFHDQYKSKDHFLPWACNSILLLTQQHSRNISSVQRFTSFTATTMSKFLNISSRSSHLCPLQKIFGSSAKPLRDDLKRCVTSQSIAHQFK